MFHKRTPKTLILLVSLILFTACAPTGGPVAPQRPTAEPISLAGTEWILAELDSRPPLANTQFTLNFEADRAGGFAGCNSYGGEYTAEGPNLAFPEVARTAMDCQEPAGVLDQESAYVAALLQAAAYQVMDRRLDIHNSVGETILTFSRREAMALDPAALPGTQWQLLSLNGAPPPADSAYTLAFLDDKRVVGHAGCRAYLYAYEADGDHIRFPQGAMFGVDDCLSEAAQVQQEGQYTDSLTWATHYRLDEAGFELLTARGETLRFAPLPQERLEGTRWELVSLATQLPSGMWTEAFQPLTGTAITAVFAGDNATGSAGCNSYSGSYEQAGMRLVIDPVGQTKLFCLEPEGIMEQEGRYVAFLEEVAVALVVGELLWLETADGRALPFTAYP